MSVASSHSNLGGGSKIGNKTKHGSRLGDMLGLSQTDQNKRTSPLNGSSLLDWKLPELCHVPTPHELTGRTFDNMPQNVRPKYKSNIAKRYIEKNFARRYYEKKGLSGSLSPTVTLLTQQSASPPPGLNKSNESSRAISNKTSDYMPIKSKMK